MTKPNEKCPCGSMNKYKKCCRAKGLYVKQTNINPNNPATWPEDETKWPNYGTLHPSYRFSIGQRVEILIPNGVWPKTTPDKNVRVKFGKTGFGKTGNSIWTQTSLQSDHQGEEKVGC